MNTIRFNSKEQFIEALEGRRAFWRAYDKQRERAHRAAERAWLQKTKATIRTALKFDYVAMKEAVGYRGVLAAIESSPSCPELMEKKLDDVLAAVNVTGAARFTVDSTTGSWKQAHSLLTWDPYAAQTVC